MEPAPAIASDAAQATPIERSTRYPEINIRSVLLDIYGPLPAALAGYLNLSSQPQPSPDRGLPQVGVILPAFPLTAT